MFQGTTPPEVKILLQDLMKGVENKDVFIGCSGNFTTALIPQHYYKLNFLST